MKWMKWGKKGDCCDDHKKKGSSSAQIMIKGGKKKMKHGDIVISHGKGKVKIEGDGKWG